MTATTRFVLATAITSCLLVANSHAWNGPQDIANQAIALAATTTLSTMNNGNGNGKGNDAATSNDAVDMSGSYADPNHPNCKRIIQVVESTSTATLTGTDGNPGCPPDGSGDPWTLTGTVNGDSIFVDFTPKGGPKDLKGVFDGITGSIQWPDGNTWTLLTAKQEE